ncbi:MAG: extracellular solute-binding protein, partial [Nitrososphaerota archaeon]|nr:extracellular solute-binding protein [Nitrososphaerota archaeon]
SIDEWGFSLIGINNGSGQARFLSYLWSTGFDIVYQDENGQWQTDVNTGPEFMEAFTRWTDLNNVHGVVPPGVTEIDFVMAANYFSMGITSLMFTGGNALGAIYDANPDLRGLVGAFMLPGDYPGTMLGTEGYSISAHATPAEQAAAMALLEFMMTNDEEMMFYRVSGKLPSTEIGLQAEFLQEYDMIGYVEQVAAGTRPTIDFPGVAGLRSELGDAYSVVFADEMTPEEAVERLIDRLETLMNDFN